MGKRGEDGLTDKQKKFVAAFTTTARGNATEAARQAGYSATTRNSLASIASETLRNPAVAAAIDAAFAEFRDEGATIKHIRVRSKLDRWYACWAVIQGRAARHAAELGTDDVFAVAAAAARSIFGTATPVEAVTGLLVKKETNTGSVTTTEWAVDTGLLKEMRELEKEIAAEVGEAPGLTMLHRHSGNVTHTHRRPDYSALSDDELDQLAELAEKVAAGTVAG